MAIDWDFLFAESLEYAAFFAAKTTTKIDDKAVELLQAIKDDETVKGWFATKLAEEEAGVLKVVAAPEGAIIGDEPPAEVVEALFDGRIFKGAKDVAEVAATLKEVLPYVLEIVKLVRMLTGK